ncbi:MAG: PAS domain S-box protein [Acidobacteria bacterium]|nr:PAS domain S-box protein [Acidobacteriota bacterium]
MATDSKGHTAPDIPRSLVERVPVTDTHERWLAEQERADAEKQFHDLLDAAPDAVLEINHEGKIVRANAAVRELFGYSPEELFLQPVEVLIPDELRSNHRVNRSVYESAPAKRPMGSGLDLYAQRRDGTRFPVDIVLSPIPTASGKFHTAAIVRNITHRKQEEILLREARTQAESANRAKSEFLASMSHELRSPLNTIMGYTQLLAEETIGPLNETQRRFVQNIERDSQHLRDLINDILDISRIEAGQLDLKREPFPLAPLLQEVVTSLQPMATERQVRLDNPEHCPATVVGDAFRTRQVVINLLTNAVKFTQPGGSVQIRSRSVHGKIAVSVDDSGIGIPAEHLTSIFDRFHQVSSTPKGVKEGTGLGLAITKKLVEQMGGTIEVTSELDKGSKFTFTLDGWIGADDAAIKVLVVEDEPRSAQLLDDYLSPEGYRVTICHNIEAALQAVAANRPQVILLDLLMPRQASDGLHLLKLLKAAVDTRSIPVVVVSVLEPSISPALTIGAAAHLTKPVHKQQLLDVLRRVVPAHENHPGG